MHSGINKVTITDENCHNDKLVLVLAIIITKTGVVACLIIQTLFKRCGLMFGEPKASNYTAILGCACKLHKWF